MAEFQEVLRQWRRMCTANRCSNCPGRTMDTEDGICMLEKPNVLRQRTEEECESIIMQWAAEHPEPVYPSWWSYLESIGVLPHEVTFAQLKPVDGLLGAIPADIAKKLGLQPKEGV